MQYGHENETHFSTYSDDGLQRVYNKHVMFLFAFTRYVYTVVQRFCTSVYVCVSCVIYGVVRVFVALILPVDIRAHKKATLRYYFVLKRI